MPNFPVATTHEPPVIESEHRDHQFPHLPERSRDKLAAIRTQRDDARTLLEAAMATVRDLRAPDAAYADAARDLDNLERTQRYVPQRSTDPKVLEKAQGHAAILRAAATRVDHYKAEIDAANKVREERGDKWKHLARLCTQLDRWLSDSNRSPIEVTADVSLAEGQSPLGELEAARALIRALTAEHSRIEGAAMSMAEVKQRVRTFVEGRAARVNARGLIVHDAFITVTFGEEADPFALLCWVDPEKVMRALEREAAGHLEGRHSMTELEQARASKDNADRLLLAERKEVALIELLAGQGMVVAYRANTDPRAVLCVE